MYATADAVPNKYTLKKQRETRASTKTMGNSLSSDVGYSSTNANTANNLYAIFHGTFGLETHTKNAISYQDLIAADAIPMDVLIADNAERKYSHGKAIGILQGTSGITSVISSSIFIWMIMRSHDRLSTTQHRLLLGLCISDIIFSLSNSTFNAMAPSDNDYRTWNARGNQATCTAQGFLVALGMYSGLFYNVSLNLYFLSVVKYKKSDEFIRAKIELFLHGVPIAIAISYSIYRLVKKHYNEDSGGTCIWPINAAPHCDGYDVGEIREGFEIPCWRGIEGWQTAYISQMVLIIIPVLIMIISLGMIYSSVRTQEKKLARYGVGALRTNLQQQSMSTPQSSGIWSRISTSLTALSVSLKAGKWSCRNTHKPVTRSNNVQSQSRAVTHKAFGYTFAWFLSWGFYIIGLITLIATGSFPILLSYLANIFIPLQGFFNLLIFMYPKIVATKKSKKRRGGETISWRQAFSIAFWSRGKGGKNQRTKRSNLRGATSNGRQKKKTKNEDAVASGIVTPPMFGRIKKKKTKRTDTTQVEEKCEIQMPDNLNPHKVKAMYSAASTATYVPNMVPSSGTTTEHTAVDFEENDNSGNALFHIVEDQDENVMLNQDEEEQMKEAEEANVNVESMAADGLVSADVKEQKEIAMDDDSKLEMMNATIGAGEQKE